MTTAIEIQHALVQWLRAFHRGLVLPNVYVQGSPWESDVIYVSKNYFWQEFEIKLSVQDYRNDFAKHWPNNEARLKHDFYQSNSEATCTAPKPKRFWFVIPQGLLDGIELPAHCGLIEFNPSWRCWQVKPIKDAPMLKRPTRLDQAAIFNLAIKAASKFGNLPQSTGFLDNNGRELCYGDRVWVRKSTSVALTDGWGRGDFGSMPFDEEYYGRIYYDANRAEFRVRDEKCRQESGGRELWYFDKIAFADDGVTDEIQSQSV